MQTPVEEEGAEGVKERKNANEIVNEFDLNHDGQTDAGSTTRRVRTVCRAGAQGGWTSTGTARSTSRVLRRQGELNKESIDLDFDGKIDQVTYFEGETWSARRATSTTTASPSLWIFYEKGQIVRKERDTNGDGKVDYWEYWENAEVDPHR